MVEHCFWCLFLFNSSDHSVQTSGISGISGIFFGQIPDSGMFRYQVFQVFFFGQIPETPKTQITCKITN